MNPHLSDEVEARLEWVQVHEASATVGLQRAPRKPAAFLGFLREVRFQFCFALVNAATKVYTLEKYHVSMVDGLMVYGMMRAVKK